MSRARRNGAKNMNPHMQSLWLALHLPYLPLEANAPLSSPSAIVERGRILVCDEAARQAGIDGGTGIAAARMLSPAITLMARNVAREAETMQTMACWAGSLTPRISLTPDTLLLEIGSCLRLFGGVEKLVTAAREGVQAQHFSVGIAVAPTPLAAQWLAQAGTGAQCLDRKTMQRHLEELPIVILPNKAAAALARFGSATLADVRKLPAAALSRRIGLNTHHLIARAFGELPDPRADFVFPDQFALSLELPASVENAPALLFAARRLTSALSGWLSARQAGIREAALRLQHRQEETVLVLQFADLTDDGGRFERVLRERLERTALMAPVESLRLEATTVESRPGRSQALFQDANADQAAIGTLLERLSARLGEEQVYRITPHDDHRPECATRHATLYDRTTPGEQTAFPRPLWLLDKPESLPEINGRPYRGGPLKLLSGPERIESGWWDGGEEGDKTTGDVRRDYFVALSADTRWLWIYRECKVPGGWYLQGYFS
jgi:protein ImuB